MNGFIDWSYDKLAGDGRWLVVYRRPRPHRGRASNDHIFSGRRVAASNKDNGTRRLEYKRA